MNYIGSLLSLRVYTPKLMDHDFRAIKEQMNALQKDMDGGALSLEPPKFEQTAPPILEGQHLTKHEIRRVLSMLLLIGKKRMECSRHIPPFLQERPM